MFLAVMILVCLLWIFLTLMFSGPEFPLASPEIREIPESEFGVVLNPFTGKFKRYATPKAWKIPFFEVAVTFPLSYGRSVVLSIKESSLKEAVLNIQGDFDSKQIDFFVGFFGSSYELERYIDKELREVINDRTLNSAEIIDDEKRASIEAQIAHEVTMMCLEKQIPFSNISTHFTEVFLN